MKARARAQVNVLDSADEGHATTKSLSRTNIRREGEERVVRTSCEATNAEGKAVY